MSIDGRGDLFGLDPNEFVAARDQLARELKAAGEKEESAAVRKLRRPTVALWALNQVARRHPDAVDELLARAADARAATNADQLRDALGRRREALAKVAKAARKVVDESGRSGDSQDRDIDAALTALVGSEGADAALRSGELTDLPEADLDAFGALGFSTAPIPDKPAPKKPSRQLLNAREEVERRRVAVATAGQAVEKAEVALATARRELETAEARLAELED